MAKPSAASAVSSPKPWLVWACGLVVAAAFCAGYAAMPVFRHAWQAHYPELTRAWANDGRFTLLGWFGTELSHEELAYAARANNASLHWPAYDPYIKDSRSRRQLVIDALTYALLGAAQAALRDINRTWLLARFLCCALWFVLLYRLIRKLETDAPFAACGAVFLTCFSYILTLLFVHNLSWDGPLARSLAHNAWTILSYGRTESVLRVPRPALTYAFLFLASLWSIKTAESRAWSWALAGGALGGALAYVRLDVWSTHILAAFAFCAVCSLKERRLHKPLLASALLAALISLPFLYYNYPPAADLLLRSGLAPRRQFDPWSLFYAAAFCVGLRGRDRPARWLLACVAAGTFFMVNIELVTGYPLQAEHWKFFGNIYVFLLALSFVPRRAQDRPGLWLGAASALVFAAFLQGLAYAAIHFPFQGLPKDYDEGLAWLQSRTPKDSVVLTLNPEVNALIPAFTHDKVELSYILAVVSDYPLLDNAERLLGGLRLLGADADRFLRDTLWRESPYERRSIVATGLARGEIEKGELYTMMFYMTPRPEARRIMDAAKAAPAELAPDYIWFGGLEQEYAGKGFPKRGQWEEAFRNASVTIYRRSTKKC
ncbi:MAG: hypothetical protein PHU21_01495 [Elusimicrobia bacterium]|nr:hypothetical protein [Elusimicrobiota bacterium]